MKKEDIPKVAKEALTDLLGEPGGVLYSSHETLQPGDVYLLGFNPGGSGNRPLGESIDSMLSYSDNAYIDECWANGVGTWEAGKSPLQERICWLLTSMGLNPREVCAANLIFLQSRNASGINYSLAKRCWVVHEAILKVVKPKLILAFGNSNVSPYAYLRAMFGGEEESMPAGHGSWLIKRFRCEIDGRPTYIVGLPHLSRYSPYEKDGVVKWVVNANQI